MFWAVCCLILLWPADSVTGTQSADLLDEFYTFESAVPLAEHASVFEPTSGVRSKRNIQNIKNIQNENFQLKKQNENGQSLIFKAFGKVFDLDLTLNTELVSEGFVVTVRGGQGDETSRPLVEKCHFRGKLTNEENSSAAVSICRHGISGFIEDGHGETYYLTPDEAKMGRIVVVRDSDKIPTKKFCGVKLHNEDDHNVSHSWMSKKLRIEREKRSLSPPSSSDRNSLYVELVMVGDVTLFEKFNRNESRVTQRFVEIASVVNALYTPLDIFVVLVGVEIWNETDKIKISNDSETTLKNFLTYRKKSLTPRMPNDNAYLISFSTFEGSVVGKALKGQMCTYDYSGGIAKDHSRLAGPTGATVAHEMGHNFGMEHDFTDCKCPDERCIMTPASVGQTPSNWSSCSRKYLEDHLGRGVGSCLKNVPKNSIGPFCGNGFLEEGEECDCGLEDFCQNKCCIAKSCTLSVNSTCGHGSCCDLQNCSPFPAATKCRAVFGECDLPEFCDGKNSFCPDDFFVADGVFCRNEEAFCFLGKCKTQNDQCEYLWGSTGAVADDKCFALNVKGNANGNCGRDRIFDNYTNCEEKNQKCGLLHCTTQVERLSVGADSATSVSQSYIPAKTTYISCRSAYIDFGMSVPDPGLVPSGAKCGENHMCLNQVCTPISDLPHRCPNNCGGAGVCNNVGHCHCNDGYSPPDCSSHGYGGSVDSGPPTTVDVYARLRDAMLIIFLLIVPVIGAVLFFCRYKIRDWMLMKKKMRRERAPPTTAQKGAPPVVAQKEAPPVPHVQSQRTQSQSMRGLRISEPVQVRDTINDTVVSVVSAGNGKMITQTKISPDGWPVVRENGHFAPGGKPPPLPQKPPKAVRDIPVAAVSPVVPLPATPVLSRLKQGEEKGEGKGMIEEIALKPVPVRPAPPPPPRPPISAVSGAVVSRNSSTGSSTKRPVRPGVRPPEPPPKPVAWTPVVGSETVIAKGSTAVTAAGEDAGQPNNSLVSELAKRFESRRRAAGSD